MKNFVLDLSRQVQKLEETFSEDLKDKDSVSILDGFGEKLVSMIESKSLLYFLSFFFKKKNLVLKLVVLGP